MSTGLTLSVYSPERKLLEKAEVEEVTLTGSEGQIQILPGHAAMVGSLETGFFRYKTSASNEVVGIISTGFFEVIDGDLTVMAENVELKGEIDVERARKAQKLSEDTLKNANLDERTFRKYQLKLQRSLIRQQLEK